MKRIIIVSMIIFILFLSSCGKQTQAPIGDEIPHGDWTLQEIYVDNMMLNIWILTDETMGKEWIIVRGYSVGGVAVVERNPDTQVVYTPEMP